MKKKKKWIVWVAVIVAIGILIAVLVGRNKPVPVFHTAAAERGTVEVEVMATGYIQPVEEVTVGTQVSGIVEKIYVDYNSHVTKGQLLAVLDKSTLSEKLVQANATLTSAQSDLLYAEQNYSRTKKLHEAKAATDVSMEEATNRLAQAKTTVSNAKANVNQARTNLSYAEIYSPIDGVVLDRQVNVGQTVAASFSTPTLFSIAEDLTKMQVEVDVDEADIGQVKVGQKAVFTVDAYNDEEFEGTVSQIRLQPIVTSNVVTYTVIVEAPNPEEKLFPGMTANINIKVDADTGLTVPLEALSFKMTDRVIDHLRSHEVVYAEQPGGSTVWVRTEHKVEQRNVETGLNDGITSIVKSGLNEGEEVVLSVSAGKRGDEKQPTSIMPRPPR